MGATYANGAEQIVSGRMKGGVIKGPRMAGDLPELGKQAWSTAGGFASHGSERVGRSRLRWVREEKLRDWPPTSRPPDRNPDLTGARVRRRRHGRRRKESSGEKN